MLGWGLGIIKREKMEIFACIIIVTLILYYTNINVCTYNA